jgi:hypothetical protein
MPRDALFRVAADGDDFEPEEKHPDTEREGDQGVDQGGNHKRDA